MVEQSLDGFDVLCTPTSLDDKGRGEVQGGVGSPHSRLSSAVLVGFRVVGVVFAIFGVRSCSYLNLLAVNG